MSYILVRRMSEDDLGEMRDLWLELIADYGGHELEYDADAEEMWRGSMLASLGRDDLGVLVAELRSDAAKMEERAGRAPRLGVASALMRGLQKELGEGPHRIYLRVPADNDAAVRFYGKNGFRISEYVMEMDLEGRAEDRL